jgi:hypothetical protein
MAACAQNERTMPVQNTGSEFWPHMISGTSERQFRMGEFCDYRVRRSRARRAVRFWGHDSAVEAPQLRSMFVEAEVLMI